MVAARWLPLLSLILGSLDLFNTAMKLELTSTFATVAETLALHHSTFFQFTLRRAERPTARLILSLPFALPALYPSTLASLPNLRVESKLKEKLNHSYLRSRDTPSASCASKRMLPLPLLRQRPQARSAISSFASLMLLNRALLRQKSQIVK